MYQADKHFFFKILTATLFFLLPPFKNEMTQNDICCIAERS